MRVNNTQTHYGIIAIILHWVFALFIFGLFASGFYMVTLGYYDPWYHPLPAWHKWFGLLLIPLLIIRMAWHYATRQPNIDTESKFEKIAAKIAHNLLLLLTVGIVFSGYLIISVDNNVIKWSGLELPVLILELDLQTDLAGFWHKYLAYGLMALIGLHIMASLKHQFIDKKKLIQKITWPF